MQAIKEKLSEMNAARKVKAEARADEKVYRIKSHQDLNHVQLSYVLSLSSLFHPHYCFNS